MKAAVYYKTGAPDVLKYEDVADPTCHPSGVVIRVEAISIEGGDTLNRWGGALTRTPHIVGYQAAGEIVEVGSEVTHLKVGQKGRHGERRRLPRRAPLRAGAQCLADSGRLQQPRGVGDPGHLRHRRRLPVRVWAIEAGETVLVQAGASGVGVAAIQLAKRAGATVLATASSDARLERLKPFGLDYGINYKTEDVVKSVMRLTDNRGVNLVVDSVGGPTLQGSILSLAYRGRVSMVGAAGREPQVVDVASLMGGNRSLSGVFLGAEIATPRVHDNIQRLIDEAAAGKLKVLIDREFRCRKPPRPTPISRAAKR